MSGGRTPLLLLCEDSDKQAIKVANLLFHYGTDINLPGDDGLTPLAKCVVTENK
jgi:hypothetical protein